MAALLTVENLSVHFHTYAGIVRAVNDVSFRLAPGEIVGLVGESGCGKSVTAQAIMGIIPQPPGKIVGGHIHLQETDLTTLSEKAWQTIRGNKIGMIFQDPMTALNPVLTIGLQLAEMYMQHQGLLRKTALTHAAEALDEVGIPAPQTRLCQYPHQLSGGMRQRVMIAMALACRPSLIIADEPTTALDATIQAQIMDLLRSINEKHHTSILLISHDLGVIAGLCSRVLVMYAGTVVEEATAMDLYAASAHPYTLGLLQSVPRLTKTRQRLLSIPGQPPDLLALPTGCAFAPRCSFAMEICCQQSPPLSPVGDAHLTRCWLAHANSPYPLDQVRKEALGR